MFARYQTRVAQTTVLQWIVLVVIVSELAVAETVAEEEQPTAEKLTKAVDKRIPPQIAYYIPDQALNDTILNYIGGYGGFNGFSGYHPPTIGFARSVKPSKHSKRNRIDTDLVAEQQHPRRYFEPIAKNHKYSGNIFGHKIKNGKSRDKKPDFKQFGLLRNKSESDVVKKVNKKSNFKLQSTNAKQPSFSFNYANTLPDLRNKLTHLKQKHKNEFDNSDEKQHKKKSNAQSQLRQESLSSEENSFDSAYSDYDYDSDATTNEDRTKATKPNGNGKSNKNSRKLKSFSASKPRYSKTKLSHAATENESNGIGNAYHKHSVSRKYSRHPHKHDRHCDHTINGKMNQASSESASKEAESLYGDGEDFENIAEPHHGFEIYLTKVIKHPKSPRRRVTNQLPQQQTAFVPTRILSSLRRINEVKHEPRSYEQPALREKLSESGGHVVYTEDGYEDSFFDHSKENKDLEYSKHTRGRSRARKRVRRSPATNVKNLKGQELIDHLDVLIRNISDYLNSSEIIPDTKYPLYNSTNANIYESPIKYSEYARPVVDDEIESDLYESKTQECDEADDGIEDDVDLSNAHNKTGGPKKRLGKLGDRLQCLKSKFFGQNPLDNPLFREDKIEQPKPINLFTSALQESDKIETIASVYSDVMDNIKFNSVNKHQRVFSDYGISDNFPLASVNVPSVAVKPVNELNTNEKYPDYKEKLPDSNGKAKKQEKPLRYASPFKDPSQLALLDISQYIPTPKYPPTASDYALQTDFQPIISPYYSIRNVTSTTTTTAKPTTVASTTQTLPLYGPVRTLPTPPSRYRRGPYRQVAAASNTIQTSQAANLLRLPHQNVLLMKHRRPIAFVRVVTNPIKPRS